MLTQDIPIQQIYLPSTATAAAKYLQSCATLCDPRDGSPSGSPVPVILQATLGCHFLLQCRKVKSESEVAQSCPTPSDPMDCSPPGSSIHGIFQARVLEWGAIAISESVIVLDNGMQRQLRHLKHPVPRFLPVGLRCRWIGHGR